MPVCGLVGEKLGHSYSGRIHGMLGSYTYELYEKEPTELEDFILRGNWDGLNVTIPYKKTVAPYCDILGADAQRTGCVNTMVRQPDGTILGDNTDVAGFSELLKKSGAEARGRKALVLGSGGASAAVKAALEDAGAVPVIISRDGENNYSNLARHGDADILVNTTPVGMYPETHSSPVRLNGFFRLSLVIDVIYNPARTSLLLQAEESGIPAVNGMYMLVAQARRSAELFTGAQIPEDLTGKICNEISFETRNIALIGMPGAGKSAVAKELGKLLERETVDTDETVAKNTGMPVEEIIREKGETAFRRLEAEVLRELGARSGAVIATGGGCVTRDENYDSLRRNSTVVWIERDPAELPREGRPLSAGDLGVLYEKRRPLYERFADLAVENIGRPADVAREIIRRLKI